MPDAGPPVGRWTVIGVGNPERGDDGFGRLAARALRRALPPGVPVIEQTGETAELMESLAAAENVVIVDACVSGAREGSLYRLDAATEPIPVHGSASSTHGLGLAEAVELARSLGVLPARCVVYLVEARAFETGAALSPRVSAALPAAVAAVKREIAAPRTRGGKRRGRAAARRLTRGRLAST